MKDIDFIDIDALEEEKEKN